MYKVDPGIYIVWRDEAFYLGHAARPFESFQVEPWLIQILFAFRAGADEKFVLRMVAKDKGQEANVRKGIRFLKRVEALVPVPPKPDRKAQSDPAPLSFSGVEIARAVGSYPDIKTFHPGFLQLYERCRRYTLSAPAGLFAVYKATQYIQRAKIPGAFVECGAWRGGSMMLAALTLRSLKETRREIVLFDVFDGSWDAPRREDRQVYGRRIRLPRATGGKIKFKNDLFKGVSQKDVRANLRSTGYPADRIHLVGGLVQETLPRSAPKKIALLRLDTDFFSSTRCELECLYPRLSEGGVLIVDDYGKYAGATRAVDRYFRTKGIEVLLQRIDIQGALAVKPRSKRLVDR